MRRTHFLLLAVVMTAVFLTACQKDVPESPEDISGLYLKSAAAGDTATVAYFDQGQAGKLVYPDNLLFSVEGSEAKVLNNFWLKVDGFNPLSTQEITFRISAANSQAVPMGEVNGQTIYAPNSENVTALKLPPLQYGEQTATGDGRFNGLLKAANYVLSVKGNTVQLYDLSLHGEPISAAASILEDTLSFDIQGVPWVLRFVKTSPIGNIFTLSIGDLQLSAYSLRF